MAVEIGTRFRAPHEATKVTWEVYRKTDDGRWWARIEDDDVPGDVAVFTTRQIEQHLSYDRVLREAQLDHEKFYRRQPVGKILHYHDGHNRFIRCEVIGNPDVPSDRKLKPIALVGNWRANDLPHQAADGSRIVPFFAQKVLAGEPFEPRSWSIYEATYEYYEHDDRALMDPRSLSPIDLS